MEISVAQAASVLRLNERRVRRLVEAGDLPGRKVGRAWLLHSDGVYERARAGRSPGRPLSQPRAWAAVLELAGQRADGLSSSSVGQVRAVLRRRLDASPDQWSALLRNLVDVHDLRVRPNQMDRLLADDSVVSADIPAADLGLVVPQNIPSVFVSSNEWPALRSRMRINPGVDNGHEPVRVIEVPDYAFARLASADVRKAAAISVAVSSNEPRVRNEAARWIRASVAARLSLAQDA